MTVYFSAMYTWDFGVRDRPFGQPSFSDPSKIGLRPVDSTHYADKAERFIRSVALRMNAALEYDLSTDPGYVHRTCKTIVRSIGKAVQFQRAEIHYSEPTGTTVEVRVWDGTDAWYWDGMDWVMAGAGDWNTPDDLHANIDTLDPDTPLGFEFRLSTLDKTLTPKVYGVNVMVKLHLPKGWAHDLIYGAIIPSLEAIQIHTQVSWSTLPAGSSVSVFELGPSDREFRHAITGVAGAFDASTDPQLKTPLSGSFAGGTFTLDTPLGEGAKPVFVCAYSIPVSWHGDRDFSRKAVPGILIQDWREEGYYHPCEPDFVRDRAAGDALIVLRRQPEYQFTLHLVSELPQDTLSLSQEVLSSWLGEARNITLITPGTAQVVNIYAPENSLRSRYETDGIINERFPVRVSGFCYTPGVAQTRKLLIDGSTTVTVTNLET